MAHARTLTTGPKDRCPNCVGRTAMRPWAVRGNQPAVVCHYRCTRCDHRWYTLWNLDALAVIRAGQR